MARLRRLAWIAFVLSAPAAAGEASLLANGGFELSARLAPKRLEQQLKAGMTFESQDPPLPLRWAWTSSGPAELRLVAHAHSGKQAARVACPNGSLSFEMAVIEVVPGATYSFAAWAKGGGKGRITVFGNAYEGRKNLARADLALGNDWAPTRGNVTIPGNIRTVTVSISFWGSAEAILDDVAFTALSDRPFAADSALTEKPKKDEHTLLLVDFDGQGEYRLENGATLTDAAGGRFGRGVRLERKAASTVGIPLTLPRMPAEGTLEFWVAPDDEPAHIYWLIALLAGDLDVIKLQADTSDSLSLLWRVSGGIYDRQDGIRGSAMLTRGWFRPGQWHHVAIQWSGEAVRYFFDGALLAYDTRRPLPFFATPSAIKLGPLFSVYAWSGAFDEIRLSDIQRYGPIIPTGAAWTPLMAAAPGPPPAAPPKARPAPDFAKERKALVAPLPPPPAGSFPFDASLLKPLVQDDEAFAFDKGKPVPGLTLPRIGNTRSLIRDPDNDGGYWALAGIQPGRYFLGVWYESSRRGLEAPQDHYGALVVHLNGRIAQLSTTSDPVQVAPGVYFSEAQSKEAVELKPGDEIAVLPARHTRFHVARLTLYPNEPVRGRGWVHENYGATWFCRDTALRMNLDCEFLAAPGKYIREVHFRQVQGAELPDDLRRTPDGAKAVARCRIANPLSVPLTVEYQAEIKAEFRETVGTDQATVNLKPHERITREIPFTIIPDSRRYTIEANAKAVHPPSLGWPDADVASYFPGLRQSVPWPDPLNARDERAIEFSGVLPGERTQFSLNGAWEGAFTPSLDPPVPPPAGIEWKPRRVPFRGYECSLDGIAPRPHAYYLRRKFDAPAGEKKTWRLVVERVSAEATVYVNGQKVGNVRGEETPLTCDVTQAIRPGANEVLLVVRDVLAIMDPAYVNPAAPVPSVQYLDAPGGQSNFAVGQVTVESAPLVAAGNVLVIPSVRKKEITTRFAVTSHEAARQSVKVTVRVLDAGTPVLELGTRDLVLESGETKALDLTHAWARPVLWCPSNPKLYTLFVETNDAATGRRLDLLRTRFGFRETWIERDRIYFNGVPVRLKGSTCQGGGGVLGADDVQWSRGTPIPDFMDEFGYSVSLPLAGIYNSSSRHNVERDAFWESARRNVLAGAARYANHPCILAWDLSNEWLSFLDYGGGDPMAGARRFRALADALTAFDPTRWIFFNGDEDLHGLHNTLSTHYMALNPISGFLFRGHSPYYPDAAFFRPLDHELQPGEMVRLSPYREVTWRFGEKVLMDTENLWKVSSLMPPGPCRFAGEDDVLSPAIDSGRGPVAWMWKLNVDAHRDLGCSAVCNYTRIWAVARRGHMIQCFIMPDHTHHGFAGQKVERKYSLHNDLFIPAAFEFRWALLGPDGKAAAEGQDKRAMESGDLQRGKLAFTLPDVNARTTFCLKLDLLADGKFAYGEERDIEVWPNAPIRTRALSRKLVLFDPAGKTADVLKKAGIAFEPIGRLAAPGGKPEEAVLVVGEGAVQDATAGESDPLRDYVAAGGRVLVLAQETLIPGLPVRTMLEAREWSSMPFVRTPQHPVLRGVSSWDLHFWSPDHVSARGAYSKPDSGSFVTLVDSGTDKGLEWVQLMECYRGKGLYLLCQLPLAAGYDAEPMARDLLARIVAYVAGREPFRSPDKPLQVVAGADSPVVSRLRDLGIPCRVVQKEAPLNAGSVLLVDATALPAPADWKPALDAGATLIVHGASPGQAPMLSALAGRAVRLTVQPYAMWEGRGYRNGFTSLTPGLSHIDLYWKEYDGSEGAVAQAEEPKHKIEDLCHWSASAERSTEHIFPGALVEIPVGKGRLILDQVRWETADPKLDRLAARVVSAMATGLNVAIEPYAPPRDLPKGIAYRPIDLTAFANRGFADEVGDDGKGGWSDQGPKIDLHEFPTGKQPFGGVPFLIGAEPHSCIVLKSNARPFPERQPAEVTIPLGFPVEGLCFLHGLTYAGAGSAAGLYQIQYADGTACDIALVAEENLRDWVSAPAEFPRERGTRSRVAWTGTTKVFPVVAIYQMLWVNPKPEVPVRAVRFANATRVCCPILIALSAAVKGNAGTAPAGAATQAARDLLKRGMEAFQAGKGTEARGLFQQALKADPSLDAAHQALGEARDKAGDEPAALAAYKAWADAGPRTPLPYNRIGEILERRKDYRAALDAYSKSLEIEWNQPPVIQARSRLMLLLKQ